MTKSKIEIQREQRQLDTVMVAEHWEYTSNLLLSAGIETTDLHRYLYISAMLHGIKHGRREKE